MTDEEVRSLARVHIDKAGGMDAWCKQTGVSRAYAYRQLSGVDAPGKSMLKALGLKVDSVTYGEAKP